MTSDDSAALPLERLLQEQVQTLLAAATPGASLGIGVDVVEIAEFVALPFAANQPFYELTFTADEIDYCLSYAAPAEHFAARFAAKEAVVKACGNIAHLTPAQVEIERAANGAPRAKLHATPALDHSYTIHVSMGHSETLAYAVALVVRAAS
jgi:holo-[acyl-carrier protein] synthase